MAAGPTLHFEVAERTDLATIRGFVRAHGDGSTLSDDELDDLVQAVDEMATNVIVHGYGRSPGRLTVAVDAGPEGVTVHLRDEAPPFDPRSWARPDAGADWLHRRPGGFGIPLTQDCVDDIYHRVLDDRTGTPGNEVTLVKRGRRTDWGSACE